jgi:hypothetical protein
MAEFAMDVVLDGPFASAVQRAAECMARLAEESDPERSAKYYRPDATLVLMAALGLTGVRRDG